MVVNAEQIDTNRPEVEHHEVFILFSSKADSFLMSSAPEDVCLYVVLSIKQTQKDVDCLFIHLFRQFGNYKKQLN